MLRRRVESNEVKIAELRASNEFLLSQNAQLRMNTVQVSRVVSTVTNTAPQAAGQSQQAVSLDMSYRFLEEIRLKSVSFTPYSKLSTLFQWLRFK